MLMIRFQRIGRKNDAAFRIAVLEKTSGPKAGKYVDLVGTYNPKTKATTIQGEKVKDWVKKGAQVSPSVMNLLINNKVMEGKKTQVISKKNLEKNVAKKAAEEAAAREAKEAADAKAKMPMQPRKLNQMLKQPQQQLKPRHQWKKFLRKRPQKKHQLKLQAKKSLHNVLCAWVYSRASFLH
jgi:small subunit ribosomal protein S16